MRESVSTRERPPFPGRQHALTAEIGEAAIGATRVMSPISSACAASMTGFSIRISMARRKPTSCVSVTVTPASGTMATRVAPAMNFADCAATTKSDAQTRPMPPPPAA